MVSSRVPELNDKRYMFYNGNGFGQSGFGYAVWERQPDGFEDSGFVILETGLDVSELYALFEDHYLSKFTHDSAKNRNLIKVFTNDPGASSVMRAPRILDT